MTAGLTLAKPEMPRTVAASRAVATPTSAATPTPAPAKAASNDEESIRLTLSRYRAAYSALDPSAVRSVWPTADVQTLVRRFDELSAQQIEFDECSVSIASVQASAFCDGSTWSLPRTGERTARRESRQWRFTFRRGDLGWAIESVSSR